MASHWTGMVTVSVFGAMAADVPHRARCSVPRLYWTTVVAAFALGTATGDMTAADRSANLQVSASIDQRLTV
jgi:hypothetical protein